MDGWTTDGWTDGWTDQWMNQWMNRWVSGLIDKRDVVKVRGKARGPKGQLPLGYGDNGQAQRSTTKGKLC